MPVILSDPERSEGESKDLRFVILCGKVGNHEPHTAASSCDPEDAMKILLGILAVLIVAASFFADYKWRQWMANHPTDEDLSHHPSEQKSLAGDPESAGTPHARRRNRQ